MSTAAQLTLIFQAVSVLAYALTAIKLLTSRIYLHYRIFFAYLLFAVPYMTGMVVLAYLNPKSQAYLWIFILLEPISMLFSVLIVFDLYRRVFVLYKGLYTVGKWAMTVAVMIAAAVSVFGVLPVLAHPGKQVSRWIPRELRIEARVDLALVLFILLIVLFLSRYPIRLSRNSLVYTGVYSVFFFSNAVGLLLWSYLGIDVNESVNAALIGISSVCALAWFMGLSAEGEEVRMHAPVLGAGSEERLLLQLDALNATLAKISRN